MTSVDADDLYGLALDRFIPERAALVRTLRSAGEREQAATVGALRKPSVAAWAVNQLIRTQPRESEELFAAGDALREIQDGVLAGSADARDLRSAAAQERDAVDTLVAAARGLLSSGGHELSAATVERVAETLHAAALDDEARALVSEGRLVRELRHVGLGAGLGAAVAVPPERAGGARAEPTVATKRDAAAERDAAPERDAAAERDATRERKAAEAAERRERDAARKQARALERDAARELDRAQRALRTAREREARAGEALHQAEAAVRDAEAVVDGAEAAHRQAAERLHGT
jgi:hypothetical protein